MGALEAATGLALLATPWIPVSLLLGVSLETHGAATVARVAGAALLALGVAFWFARGEGESRATRALLAAMLLYNVTVVALLVHSRLGLGLSGIGLWPVVALHAALAAWSIACIRPSNSSTTDPARR
jgi:hypothetical protein